MKRSVRILLAVFIIAAMAYIVLFGFIKTRDSEFAVASDTVSGIYWYCSPGYSFAWQGIIPGRLKVTKYNVSSVDIIETMIPITPLKLLKSDFYAISATISISYKIDVSRLAVPADKLASDGSIITEQIRKALQGYLEKEITPYCVPYYNRNGLARDSQLILKAAEKGLKSHLDKLGIVLNHMELSGTISFPDAGTFNKGMALLNELRRIEDKNKQELFVLKNRLKKEVLIKNKYFQKLSDISKIIKENPDILKYIYIDRMADNVKVIIAPEKSGIPLNLGESSSEKRENRKREVNNLR